jgi:hypothetical protein
VVNEFSVEDLQNICGVLNGENGRQLQTELTRLVKAWEASGPNLRNMMHEDAQLSWDLQQTWKMIWVPSEAGGAQIGLLPSLPDDRRIKFNRGKGTPYGQALIWFYLFTLNPHWERLSGPCDRCCRYYIAKSARNKRYCSRRCGSMATAVASTRRRLDQEHKEKVLRAELALRGYNKTNTQLDWKGWISFKEPDITRKWLTRAFNSGKLHEPKAPALSVPDRQREQK